MDIRTVAVDDGAGDSEGDGVVVPQSHDLDILPDGGILLPEFRVNELGRVPDNSLDIREGGMPDTKGGVVRPGHLAVAEA